MTPLLVHIPYSPWSLRARLALTLGGVEHRRQVYLPTLGEPGLRLRLRRWRGKVTVPVLFTDHGPLTDSLDIARFALEGGPYWPDEGQLARWHAHSEEMLAWGRVRTTKAVLDDPVALRESLPPFVRAMGPVGAAIGRDAARRLLRKYGREGDPEQALARGAAELAAALEGRTHLVGDRLTMADVTAAVGWSFVDPPAVLPLGENSRTRWTCASVRDAFPQLSAWRDGILAEVAAAKTVSAR